MPMPKYVFYGDDLVFMADAEAREEVGSDRMYVSVNNAPNIIEGRIDVCCVRECEGGIEVLVYGNAGSLEPTHTEFISAESLLEAMGVEL